MKQQKKERQQKVSYKKKADVIEPGPSNMSAACYKSFDNFKTRISSLKLYENWKLFDQNEHFVSVFNYDHIHTVPKFEVYVYASLNLMIRAGADLDKNLSGFRKMHRPKLGGGVAL